MIQLLELFLGKDAHLNQVLSPEIWVSPLQFATTFLVILK
jgi:hypothetical protein